MTASNRLVWEANRPDFMGRPGGLGPVIEAAKRAAIPPRGLARMIPEGLRRIVIQRAIRTVEAMGGGTLLGNWGSATSDRDFDGYRPLGTRIDGLTRDLDAWTYDRQIRMALYLYATNPLAGWLVDNLVDIVLGQRLGFTVKVDTAKLSLTDQQAAKLTADINDHLSRFWKHPAHSLDARAGEYATTWLVTGVLLMPAVTNESDGVPMLDLIDAQQIARVESADKSAIVPGRVWYRSGIAPGDAQPLEVIRQRAGADDLLGDKGKDEQLAFYFPLRSLLNQLMGTSFLLRSMDWLDRTDQFMFAGLDRARATNMFAWHLQMKGLTPDQCKTEAARHKKEGTFNEPASIIVTNEEATLEAVSPKLEAGDTDTAARTFRNHILGSYSRPESWYAHGGETNRATASEQGDVAYKALERWQERFRGLFETMLHFAYDSGRAAQPALRKSWPSRISGGIQLSVEMPPIKERDYSRVGGALAVIADALEVAEEGELISHETAQRVFMLAAAKLGAEIDPVREKEQIDAEAKDRAEKEAQRQADEARARYDAALNDGTPDPAAPPRKPAPPPPMREGAEPTGPGLAEALVALAVRPAAEVHHHTHLPTVAVTAEVKAQAADPGKPGRVAPETAVPITEAATKGPE